MKYTRITFRLLAGSAILAAGGTAGLAHAQQAEGSFGVNEIIVTAQKREQSIQDVPIAVSALGEETLQSNRISSTLQLTGMAPGLISRVNPGGNASPSFSLRGVSANASVPNQDRQIPIYLDGAYVGGNRGSISDVIDLERIEVLRGPQGTLFGRNSTAGAVQFITRNPTGEMAFRQDLTYGNYDQLRTRTTIDTPAFGPFSAYFTFVHDERRGDVRNLGAGTTFDRTNPFSSDGRKKSPKWLGGFNKEIFNAALRYDDGGAFTATYKFDWFNGTNAEARPIVVINPADPTGTGALLLALLATQPAGGGAYGPIVFNTADRRPKATNNAWTVPTRQRVQGHNLTLTYQATDELAFKNIFAYRKSRSLGPVTIDGFSGLEYTAATKALFTAPQAFLGGFSFQQIYAKNNIDAPVGSYLASYGGNSAGNYWQISDELQVNYSTDKLDLTAGAMYFYSKSNDGALDGFTNNFFLVPVGELLPMGHIYDDDGTTKSLAAYLQVEYQLTDQLGVVAGGRITKERKWSRLVTSPGYNTYTGDRSGSSSFNYDDFIGATVAGEGVFKETKPSFEIGLNYKPNDDVLLYAKFATAFLTGGATGDITFGTETADSWEAGIKSDWFDGRLRFNLTGYYVKYKHSQAALSGRAVDRPDLGVAVIDLGNVDVKGLELDLTVVPADGFTLGGTLGWSDDKLKNVNPLFAAPGSSPSNPGGYYGGPRPVDRTTTPTWVGSGYAQYITPPLFGDATMQFRLDATYQSKTRAFAYKDLDTVNTVFKPYEFIGSKILVNGRIALRDIDVGGGNLEIGVWGKNLTDNKKGLYPFDFGQILYSGNYEQARTYGADLIFKFNP